MTFRLSTASCLVLLLCACGDDGSDSSPNFGTSPADTGAPATSTGQGDGDTTADSGSGPSADSDGGADSTGDDTGNPDPPPAIHEDPAYRVSMTTITYGQGMTHSDWGGPSNGTIDLLADVYEPTDAPPGRPGMVIIHGGGFTGGSRSNANSVAFAEYFAERGWVAISIDYRIADHHGTVPEDWANFVEGAVPSAQQNQGYALYPSARDAKAAVRWFSANADTYQIDTGYMTALGGSAGSYLAIMLGVTNPEDFRDEIGSTEDPTLESTNLGEGAQVHTIIDHWGGISQMEILELLDGVSRFDATDAPVSIVHGTADSTVLFEEAEKLRDAYIETGVPYDFHPLKGVGHGDWDVTVDGMNLRELAFAFVVEHRGLTVVP